MSINRHRFAKNNTKHSLFFPYSRTLLNSILGGGGGPWPADVKCGGRGAPCRWRSHEIGGLGDSITLGVTQPVPREFNEI